MRVIADRLPVARPLAIRVGLGHRRWDEARIGARLVPRAAGLGDDLHIIAARDGGPEDPSSTTAA